MYFWGIYMSGLMQLFTTAMLKPSACCIRVSVNLVQLGYCPCQTLVLHIMSPQHGSALWVDFRCCCTHVPSCRLLHYEELPPSDLVAYLVGCLPGVGVSTAERIITGLQGRDVIEVFNSHTAVEQLSAIKGIGLKMAQKHKQHWDESRGGHGWHGEATSVCKITHDPSC